MRRSSDALTRNDFNIEPDPKEAETRNVKSQMADNEDSRHENPYELESSGMNSLKLPIKQVLPAPKWQPAATVRSSLE